MRRLFLTLIFLCLALPAAAVSLISDEEAESWLYDLLTPIFRAANLPLNRDYVHIVKDDSLNAFVGDQNHMFVHTTPAPCSKPKTATKSKACSPTKPDTFWAATSCV